MEKLRNKKTKSKKLGKEDYSGKARGKKNCSGKAKEQAKEQKLQRKSQGTKNYSRMAMYRTVIFQSFRHRQNLIRKELGFVVFYSFVAVVIFVFKLRRLPCASLN